MRALLIAAFAFAVSPATAADAPQLTAPDKMPAGQYVSDNTHTSVTWRVNHMNLSNYTARFTKADAVLNYDPADVTRSTLKVVIDPTSLRTDYPNPEKEDFDKKLSADPAWLNAGQFPQITFESTKIEKTGDSTGKIHGNMTMLGVTKPLVLDVTFNGAYLKRPVVEDTAMGFSATAKLKRSDWGFATYVPVIGDEVAIQVEIELTKTSSTAANPA